MTNPFEFFNASDDEEDNKVNVVKNEEKQKRSNFHLTQLTKRRSFSRSSKRRAKIITRPLPLAQ